MNTSWLYRMLPAGRTRSGVRILVHWSVPALALVFLGWGWRHLEIMSAAIAAYLAILVIHEVGHQIVAQRRGYAVMTIEIYPLHGRCTHAQPNAMWDEALIAWGGVVAQCIVAIPIIVYVKTFGSTGFRALDVVLSILGFSSIFIAAFNLIPVSGLDGRKAWKLVPLAWKKYRQRKTLVDMTPMEAMEEALRKAAKRRSG